jgi:hypothetical protein
MCAGGGGRMPQRRGGRLSTRRPDTNAPGAHGRPPPTTVLFNSLCKKMGTSAASQPTPTTGVVIADRFIVVVGAIIEEFGVVKGWSIERCSHFVR